MECLLPFSWESLAIAHKYQSIQNYYFAFCFVWVKYLFSHSEGRTLKVFESRVLRKIVGFKWQEVVGDWRKIYDEDLRDWYLSSDIYRVTNSMWTKWARCVASVAEEGNVYRFLVGKHKGRIPFERPRLGDMTSQLVLVEQYGNVVWFVLLRMGTGGEPSWTL